MAEQNLLLCLLFSALGGVAVTLGTAVLIREDDREKRLGIKISRCRRMLGLALTLTFQGLSTLFYTIAPWYGPVSLYRPTAMSAKLLSNMVVVGGFLKKGDLKKDTQVATVNCVLAVVILPLVGPGIQEDQDVEELFLKPWSLAWNVAFLILFIVSSVYMFVADLKKKSQSVVQTCLLTVSVVAAAMSATISKAMIGSSGVFQVVLVVLYIIMQIIWLAENVIEATAVKSFTIFVPVFAVLSLVTNAANGLLIWEDWRVIASWVGYITVFLLLLMGVYLLSDLDLFKQEQEQIHRITKGRADLFVSTFSEQDRLPIARHSLPPHGHNQRENDNARPKILSIIVPETGQNLSFYVRRRSSGIGRLLYSIVEASTEIINLENQVEANDDEEQQQQQQPGTVSNEKTIVLYENPDNNDVTEKTLRTVGAPEEHALFYVQETPENNNHQSPDIQYQPGDDTTASDGFQDDKGGATVCHLVEPHAAAAVATIAVATMTKKQVGLPERHGQFVVQVMEMPMEALVNSSINPHRTVNFIQQQHVLVKEPPCMANYSSSSQPDGVQGDSNVQDPPLAEKEVMVDTAVLPDAGSEEYNSPVHC